MKQKHITNSLFLRTKTRMFSAIAVIMCVVAGIMPKTAQAATQSAWASLGIRQDGSAAWVRYTTEGLWTGPAVNITTPADTQLSQYRLITGPSYVDRSLMIPSVLAIDSTNAAHLIKFFYDGHYVTSSLVKNSNGVATGWNYTKVTTPSDLDQSTPGFESIGVLENGAANLISFKTDGNLLSVRPLNNAIPWGSFRILTNGGNIDRRSATPEVLAISNANYGYMIRFDASGAASAALSQLPGGNGWTYSNLTGPANLDPRDPTMEAIGIAANQAFRLKFGSDGTYLPAMRTQLAGGSGWTYKYLSDAAQVFQPIDSTY